MTDLDCAQISLEHDHVFLGPGHERSEKRAWAVIALCGAMMVLEVVGGLLFGSIALIADGLHMSTHAGALLLAALAYFFARRHAHDGRFTFGTGKLGDLAGFTSAIVLAFVAILIAYEALTRFLHPVPISFREAMPIAVLGLLVNVVSVWLLGVEHDHGHHDSHGHSHAHGQDPAHYEEHEDAAEVKVAVPWRNIAGEIPKPHTFPGDLQNRGEHETVAFEEHDSEERDSGSAIHTDNNIRAAVVHVLADAAVSVLVIVGLVLAWLFGWTWTDPLAGMIGAVVISAWSWSLVRASGAILLDMNPDRRLTERVRAAIEEDGDKLSDLHVWRLGPGHLGAIVSVGTAQRRGADFYKAKLGRFSSLSHVTVEVWPARSA